MARINVLKSAFTVGAFTALSRVLGLVREMMQSRLIGAGMESSAFALAFMIPNTARKLFGEGALTAAFVPIFKNELENSAHEKAVRLARAVMTMAVMMLAAIVTLGLGGIEAAGYMAAKLGCEQSDRMVLTIKLVKTLLPYMIFICGSAFGMGVLNAMGKFKASSFMPCLLNVIWICGLGVLIFMPDWSLSKRVQFVSVAILFAGVLQLSFMMWRMYRAGVAPVPQFTGWRERNVALVWRNTAVAAIGAGAVHLNYMLDTALAQLASEWTAGVIGFAERLMDLPLGIVGVAFGTVLLPAFSECFAKGDMGGARKTFSSATVNMMLVMIPAAVGLGILAPEAVSVIYKGGEFDSIAVTRVARAVSCYSAGLVFFGLQKSLVPWFHAQNDMKTPLKVSAGMVILNATLNCLAVFCLPVEWRHVGLAGSTVFCAALSCLVLAAIAVRKSGDMGFKQLIPPAVKMVSASLLMAVVILVLRAVRNIVVHAYGFDGMVFNAVTLGVMVVCGMAVYFMACAILVPQARAFIKQKIGVR